MVSCLKPEMDIPKPDDAPGSGSGNSKTTAFLISQLNRPLTIGDRQISPRLVLAPMSGLGHVAFRDLLEGFGGYGLMFSEMCSARAIPHENRYVSPYFRWRDEEISRLVLQIFGNDPEVMAKAAVRIENEGFFGVDLNFGCAVQKICSKNCGAAILKTPELAVRIVEAVRDAVSIPVFVKFRTGWKDDPEAAAILAEKLENAGADALTFHPRVAPDQRTRPPKWEHIRIVKKAVSIPVFGNGNVFDSDDCRKILEVTGCDGVSLGRIAVARPWIFVSFTRGYACKPIDYRKCALELTGKLSEHYEPVQAWRRFKRFACYFAANFRFGHTFYSEILSTKNMSEIKSAIEAFFSNPPELVENINLNLYK